MNSCRTLFNATQAYECLISVPFVPAVATRFLKYYNESMQFQSTLAYLKNPPSSYQQPPVDFLQGLEQIQQDINNGVFANQYAFESTLQSLIYSAHDTHVNLVAGILSAFTFASPYGIVSVSTDGVRLPEIYISGKLLSHLHLISDTNLNKTISRGLIVAGSLQQFRPSTAKILQTTSQDLPL